MNIVSLAKYVNRLIPLEVKVNYYTKLYFYRKLKLKVYNGTSYSTLLDAAIDDYVPEINKQDSARLHGIVSKCIRSFLLRGFKPHEFFIYDLEKKNEVEWGTYLAEKDRVTFLHRHFLDQKYELRDKWVFYEMAKPFFKRRVFHLTKSTDVLEFKSFAGEVVHLFCKPNQGHMGIGIHKIDLDSGVDLDVVYHQLLNECDDWIVEETISQAPELSVWNESSVNTIRFPAFLKNGVFTPYYPRIRTGRKGCVIDNVAQGGLVALIDAKTGVITTDGFLKKNQVSETHPDSGINFKGTQIPHWDELLIYAETIHRSLPRHIYIAWDFAYSEKGWDVVEANWGQMDSTQMMIGHGIKKEFLDFFKD